MKQAIRLVGVVLILLFLSGCVQMETLIKVKPDGSGTVEETFLMNKEAIQQIEQMTVHMGPEPTEGQPQKGLNIFDEAKLKEKASSMGKGVTYLSGKKLTTETAEGYQAIYSFTDINNLKINQDPDDKMPEYNIGLQATPRKGEFMTFQFTKGTPATLIVQQPFDEPADKPKQSEEPEPQQVEDVEQAMAVFQTMFKDMKITSAIEIEGTIVETNATHRKGSKITLMEMDFDELIRHPKKFKEFVKSNPETFEKTKKFMKDSPGSKVDLNREVIIKFE